MNYYRILVAVFYPNLVFLLEPVFKGSSFSPILIFSINFYE